MKPSSTKRSSVQHRVPNNPQADQQLTGGHDWDAKAEAQARKKTLYDATSRPGYYRTHAGHWKQRDEPDEDEQLRQADRINQVLKARREKESRERLKQKGAVPTKDGKKLFDEFMREANAHRPSSQNKRVRNKDLDTLRNLYSAASALEFDQWMIFLQMTLGV
jgi:hypothetical protein